MRKLKLYIILIMHNRFTAPTPVGVKTNKQKAFGSGEIRVKL